MFSTLRNRFGIPGVISVIALVFAMVGGAFAANNLGDSGNGATASAKKKAKKGPRGPRGPKGATGAAGPAGPAGAPGAKGDSGAAGAAGEKGAPGTPGTAGANGKTVLNGAGTPAAGLGTDGDFYIDTSSQQIYGPKKTPGGWGPPTSLKGSNGTNGSPWVLGTAPSGVLMKGTWAVHSSTPSAGEVLPVPISFTVPVGGEVAAVVAPSEEAETVWGCTGTADSPTASETPGIICMYAKTATNVTFPFLFEGELINSGAGVIAPFKATAAAMASAHGSWAMITP